MADKILEMEIDTQTLRGQVRFLTDEVRWLDEGLRAKENELEWAKKYMESLIHREGKHGPKPPENYARDRVGPVEKEIEALQARKAMLQTKLEATKQELDAAVALLDKCRRFSGVSESGGREVTLVPQTGPVREFSPYL